jgi:hypothetical protein
VKVSGLPTDDEGHYDDPVPEEGYMFLAVKKATRSRPFWSFFSFM